LFLLIVVEHVGTIGQDEMGDTTAELRLYPGHVWTPFDAGQEVAHIKCNEQSVLALLSSKLALASVPAMSSSSFMMPSFAKDKKDRAQNSKFKWRVLSVLNTLSKSVMKLNVNMSL
jgi:hypothetical protein